MPASLSAIAAVRPKNSVWLIAPPILACILDITLTLHGQPEEYWQGQYNLVHEWTPPARLLLEIHPLAFLGGIVAWVASISAFILLAPRRWALDACLFFTFGHVVGACSWLRQMEPNGLWYCALVGFATFALTLPVWKLWRKT